jgi:hypothetical protein
MKYTNIRVLVGRSRRQVDDRRCEDVRECDTLKEAKAFAKYALTEEYRASGELSELMNNSRVMATEDEREVCLEDYTRKGYEEPADAAREG